MIILNFHFQGRASLPSISQSSVGIYSIFCQKRALKNQYSNTNKDILKGSFLALNAYSIRKVAVVLLLLLTQLGYAQVLIQNISIRATAPASGQNPYALPEQSGKNVKIGVLEALHNGIPITSYGISWSLDPGRAPCSNNDLGKFYLRGNEIFMNIDANFESPLDDGANNSYCIGINGCQTGNTTNCHKASFALNITNVALNPTDITVSSSFPEILDEVGQLGTVDPDFASGPFTYTIIGGADSRFFSIGGSRATLVVSPQDYENPGDSNRDGVYEVTIRSVNQKTGGSIVKELFLTLTNVDEGPVPCTQPEAIACPSSARIVLGSEIQTKVLGGDGGALGWAISPANGVNFPSGTGTWTPLVKFSEAGVFTVTFTSVNSTSPQWCSIPATTQCTREIEVYRPACESPSPITLQPNGTVWEGTAVHTTASGGSNGNMMWTIEPSSGVSQASGSGSSAFNISFNTQGVYTITFTSTNSSIPSGCEPASSVSASRTITVIPVPVDCSKPSPLNCEPATSIRAGKSVSSSTSGGSGGNITWSISPTTGVSQYSGSGTFTGDIVFSNIGTYTLTYTSTNNSEPSGCVGSASVSCTRQILVCPPAAKHTTSTENIVENETKSLTADPLGGIWSVVSGGGMISGTTYTPADISSDTQVTLRYTIAASGSCAATQEDLTFTVTALATPDLSTEVSQPSPMPVAGQPSSLSIKVANMGTGATIGAIITTVQIPTGTSFGTFPADNNGWTCSTSGTTATCTNTGTIANGSENIFQVPFIPTPAQVGTSLTIPPASTTGGGEPAANNSNNSSTAVTTPIVIGTPDLSTEVSQPIPIPVAGQPSSLSIKVANMGTGATIGAIITTVQIPTGTSFGTFPADNNGWTCSTSGTTATCTNTGTIANGSENIFQVPFIPTPAQVGTSLTIPPASTTGGGELAANNSNNSSTSVTTPIVTGTPDLSTEVSQPIPVPVAGQPSSLSIKVANMGTGATIGAIITTVQIPTGTSFGTFPADNNGWTCSTSGTTATCTNTGTIANGSENIFQVPFIPTPAQVGTSLTIPPASTTGGGEPASNNSNNSSTAVITPIVQVDSDGDGISDSTDSDDDNDGILDTVELASAAANGDTDGDGIIDSLDLDSDNDGINDVREVSGTDANGDGLADGTSNAQGIPSSAGTMGLTPPDTDGDGQKDFQDLDSDNDTVSDLVESGSNAADTNSDGIVDGADDDKDGIKDAVDGKPNAVGDLNDSAPKNTDGTDQPDYRDPDSNNDGVNDIVTNGFGGLDTNGDGKVDNPTDPDKDGIANNNGLDTKPTVFGGLSSTATTTAKVNVKVLLQGALFGTTGTIMRDNLRVSGIIPTAQPYSTIGNTYPRLAHIGSEAIGNGVLTITGNDAIVDWVLVELRDANNPATIVKTKAALVQRDGDIVESSDGITPVTFVGVVGQSYYFAVKHRNHLGAMTATAIPMTATGTTVDFTTMTAAQLYNSTATYDGLEQVDVNGKKALWAGNASVDGKVKYMGSGNDQSLILNQVLTYSNNVNQIQNYDLATPVYLSGDINMDGKVKYRGSGNDASFILNSVVNIYLLNTVKTYNYDLFVEQIP